MKGKNLILMNSLNKKRLIYNINSKKQNKNKIINLITLIKKNRTKKEIKKTIENNNKKMLIKSLMVKPNKE